MKEKTAFAVWMSIVLLISLVACLLIQMFFIPHSEALPPTEDDTFRVAFFSDIHIQNSKKQVQTDLGAPSSKIPRNTRVALNSINPDYIFSTGDLTAHTEPDEWKGYKHWSENLEVPVADILGNHDREHHLGDDYGTGYFTELERLSGTKVLKLGNNVFVLISEEHNPEYDGNTLGSTIPRKTFEFVESYLKEYAESNNIFIISHTPLSGTTAYSKTWYYGQNENWIHTSGKFMDLLYDYDVTAHISGHTHTDYRWRDRPNDRDGTKGVENVGKFVDGEKITNSARRYPPRRLPCTYFLNMPVADFAHGWASRYYFPDFSGAEEGGNWYRKYEEIGLPLFDIFHTPLSSDFFTRGAVYYTNFVENQEKIELVTRWASGNRDMEEYEIELNHPVKLGDREMHFVASDLSLRKKENLTITRDNWFKIKAGGRGTGTFSKRFKGTTSFNPEDIIVESRNLEDYSVEWWGKQDLDNSWRKLDHHENEISVKAVKIKVSFEASRQKDAYVEDINLPS